MSAVTFTVHRIGHLYILFPYIQIIMGIAIFEMSKDLGDRFKSWKMVIILLVLMLVIVNTKVSLLEHRKLMREKVHKSTCDISKLISWLLKNKYYHTIVFNLDDQRRLEFYSNGKINPFCLLPHAGCKIKGRDANFSLVLESRMSNWSSKIVYIFEFSDSPFLDYGAGHYNLETYKIFRQLAKKLDKEIIIRKEFLYSDGRPRYLIVSLK